MKWDRGITLPKSDEDRTLYVQLGICSFLDQLLKNNAFQYRNIHSL